MPKNASKIAANGVLEYLRNSLPRATLLDLYQDEGRGRFVCRAVLQQLSEVAQQIIMRLLVCGEGSAFPLKSIKDWVVVSNAPHAPSPSQQVQSILKELHKWGMLHAVADSNGKMNLVALEDSFRKGLEASITNLSDLPWKAYTDAELREIFALHRKKYRPISPDDLERYTQQQWDAVLHFLVGTQNVEREPPKAVVQFLLETGLMQPDPDYRGANRDLAPLVITQDGYDFMLQDNSQQVWHFVTQYLETLEAKKKSLVQEAMLLLISLSFAKIGQAYGASSLSRRGRGLIKDLGLFGLLLEETIGDTTIFYPTRIALQLVESGAGAGGGNSPMAANRSLLWTLSTTALQSALSHPRPKDSSHLAIIVQTNFQVCAYTTSELHVSMLGLFCDVQTIRRLPNVVFLMMTRDSIKSAFALGIQASQVLSFLEKHAHPKLRKALLRGASGGGGGASVTSLIPPNVEDQIWLWDREQTRLIFDEVWMYQCHKKGEYEAVVQKARSLDALAWCSGDATKGQVLIHYEHAQDVLSFIQTWRAEQEGL